MNNDPFYRLAPAVQEFILRSGWNALRAVQSAAIGIILDTDDNLLLATGTASGKTEAAFMPAITSLLNKPARSVGILYISPLKALINDQFDRIGSLLSETNIPICKWHGDASESRKRRVVGNPRGVLQITPESLEGLLDRDGSTGRANGCARMFADLRFVIIDEVHAFMNGPRGIQTLCLLERLQRLIGHIPRRIGLSATLGDTVPAERWLSMGTDRRCVTPRAQDAAKRIRLAMFEYEQEEPPAPFAADGEPAQSAPRMLNVRPTQFYEDLYRFTLGKKAIIFARSRADVEEAVLNLRGVAKSHGTPDIYRAHHGSISASLREQTERELKASEGGMVVAATITLELGIDIGELDMVVQLDAPSTVSAFVQRLGRCGRKGQRAELMLFLTGRLDLLPLIGGEYNHGNYRAGGYISGGFDWSLLRSIASVQLYITEKWVEPPDLPQAPYALLYHQTMAHLLSFGACEPSALARAALTLAPFAGITRTAYQTLLRHLIDVNHLARTEEGLLMIGAAAEPIVSTYRFCAVFESPEEYDVQFHGQSIGSVYGAPPVGSRIVLAGRVWECVKALENRKVVIVDEATGSGTTAWRNPVRVPVHDRVAAMMRDVLASDTVYPYLDEAAVDRLTAMRRDAGRIGMLRPELIPIDHNHYIFCPWVGTRRLSTLALALESEGVVVEIQPGGFDPVYLAMEYSGGRAELGRIVRRIRSGPVDLEMLSLNETHVIPAKYNEYIPLDLLHEQYRRDALWPG
ncbi:MAG: DEAD/DEAH box helicase [Oscillospiraceae bacterium]|jgi:ATP-dependent Lhr-like helicase|nr:DEAD/DEAH box helicase [Oscillospiraceae bacterium]